MLRSEWGFNGYVISDEGAIEPIEAGHGYTKNATQTAAVAVNGGTSSIGVPKWGGRYGRAPPSRSNRSKFFHFHAVFRKNICPPPPVWEILDPPLSSFHNYIIDFLLTDSSLYKHIFLIQFYPLK